MDKINIKSKAVLLIFYLALAFSLLHTLRNVSSAYLIASLFFTSALFVIYIYIKTKETKFSQLEFLIIISWTYATILTFLNYFILGLNYSPIIGLSRLFFIFPVILFIAYVINNNNFETIFKLILITGVIGATSIVYQHFIGEITWLADPGERSGLARFSSTLGSLTIYGTVVGGLIIICCYVIKHTILKTFFLFLLIAAAVLSLQKAALASLLLGLLISLRISTLSKKEFLLILTVIAICTKFIYTEVPFVFEGLQAFLLNTIGITDNIVVTDFTVEESVIKRFTEHPASVIHYWGLGHLIIGVGVFASAGSLGYPDVPHPHNLLLEIVSLFGPLAIFYFYLFAYSSFLFVKKIIISNTIVASPLHVSVSLFFVTFLPSIFSGGVLYHPVVGVILFSALAIMLKSNVTPHHNKQLKSYPPSPYLGGTI